MKRIEPQEMEIKLALYTISLKEIDSTALYTISI